MSLKTKNIDMCSGPLFANIWKFAFPFMLTAIIQHLYNAADVIVVGRYAGREALAGVGTTGSLTSLMINFIVGLATGVSVAVGRALGAKNEKAVHETVHTAMVMCFICGTLISVVGVVFAEFFLELIDVPPDVMPQAKIYMQITFSGKLAALIYNFGSAILRANGDTKRPLMIVTISGIVNVLLNLFFVIKLGMQADGVALATVVAQVINAVCIIAILAKEENSTKLIFNKLKIYKKQFVEIIRVGIPAGIQSVVFSLSNVLVQSGVNSFNAAAIAGSAASANIGNFYYSALEAFSHASLNFVSQNAGAKKYKRINKIVAYCLLDILIVWGIEAFVTFAVGEKLIGIYAPGDFEAIKMGIIRLSIVGGTYGLCGLMSVMSGALRGLGNAFGAMIISIVGVCGIRILWVLTVFEYSHTFQTLFISYPVSWIGTFLMHSLMYIYVKRRLDNKKVMR